MKETHFPSLSVEKILVLLSRLAVVAVVLCSLVFPRLSVISGAAPLESWITRIWWAVGIHGFVIVLLRRPWFGIGLATFVASLWAHSFAELFQPSLSPDVPLLDFLFFDTVSSHYCFSFAEKYLTNLAVPFAVFAGSFILDRGEGGEIRFIFRCLLVAVAANLAVVAVQGLWSLNFLAQGSGSAVGVHRAPGLLEDSGASTIVLSGLMAFFLSYLVQRNQRSYYRYLPYSLWALGFLIGFFTGGRSYFFLLAISLGVLACLDSTVVKNRVVRRAALFVLIGLFSLGIWFFKARIFLGLPSSEVFSDETLLVRLIGWLDPIRGVHTAILWKSILEYWPTGVGLGGSFIAIAEHSGDFLQKKAAVAGDAPLNYYLGFILETGFAGGLIILAIAGNFGHFLWNIARGNNKSPYDLPFCVLSVCLVAAGLVGTQVLHRSYATLFALSIAFLLLANRGTWVAKFLRKTSLGMLLASSIILLSIAGGLYLHPVKVPEFYWTHQGKSQIPLGYSVPIATPEKSQWLPPNIPIAVRGEDIVFFVEMPPQFYPIQVSLAIYASETNEMLQYVRFEPIPYLEASPGKVLSASLQPGVADYCSTHSNPRSYCFVRISTLPEWNMQNTIKVGYSLMNPKRF